MPDLTPEEYAVLDLELQENWWVRFFSGAFVVLEDPSEASGVHHVRANSEAIRIAAMHMRGDLWEGMRICGASYVEAQRERIAAGIGGLCGRAQERTGEPTRQLLLWEIGANTRHLCSNCLRSARAILRAIRVERKRGRPRAATVQVGWQLSMLPEVSPAPVMARPSRVRS